MMLKTLVRRRQKALTMVIVAIIPLAVAGWWCLVPVEYRFDATKTSIEQFGWREKGEYKGRSPFEVHVARRRREVTVTLPNLPPYQERSAASMAIESTHGTLRAFRVSSEAVTVAEALERA